MTLGAILLLILRSGMGVVFMAATNRADLLDNALTRPGRFDWRVFISKPDQEGREAILKASQPPTRPAAYQSAHHATLSMLPTGLCII